MKVEFEKLAAAGKIKRFLIPQLVALTEKGLVRHRSWGIGRIKSVDTVFSRLRIDFQGKPNHIIDLNFAAEILKPANENDNAPGLQVQHLNWKLLPPGELNLKQLRLMVQSSARRQNKELAFDVSRLDFLISLNPTQAYAGLGEFDGYLAFLFKEMDGAVLENPMEGNAIYVFDSHWRELSKVSKTELFQKARHQFKRVVHTGDWQSRIRAIVLK